MNPLMSNPLVLAELEIRCEVHAALLAMPWTNLNKMGLIRQESRRRLAAEAQHPVLHWLTKAAHTMAHETPVSLKGKIEWLCSPWRHTLPGQVERDDDLIWAPQPTNGADKPLLQIADAPEYVPQTKIRRVIKLKKTV